MGVGDARNGRHAAPQLMRDLQIGGAVAADDADVDLRRQPEVKNLGRHVGGLEIEGIGWKCGREHFTELADIVGCRRVSFLQRHQDHAVIDVDGRSIGEGEIVHALRNADVVDDEVAIALRDNLADLVFDLLEDTLSGFDARGGGRADVKLDLSPVDLGEKIVTDKHQRDAAEHEYQRGDDRDN